MGINEIFRLTQRPTRGWDIVYNKRDTKEINN